MHGYDARRIKLRVSRDIRTEWLHSGLSWYPAFGSAPLVSRCVSECRRILSDAEGGSRDGSGRRGIPRFDCFPDFLPAFLGRNAMVSFDLLGLMPKFIVFNDGPEPLGIMPLSQVVHP